MSFTFRLGQQLGRIQTPPIHQDDFIDLPGYNTDSDNDVSDYLPDPDWNYYMPQADVESILAEDAHETRFREPQIPLPPETKRLSVTFPIRNLKKLAMPMIAACNTVCPHPGPKFNKLPSSDRSDFLSLIISAPILPPLEYFAQFTVDNIIEAKQSCLGKCTVKIKV